MRLSVRSRWAIPQSRVWPRLPQPARVAVVRLLGALASRAALSWEERSDDGPGRVSGVGPGEREDPPRASGSAGGGVCAPVEPAAGAGAYGVDPVAVCAAQPDLRGLLRLRASTSRSAAQGAGPAVDRPGRP